MQISIIGLDIAKQVFQVHAADAEGRRVAKVRLRRAQVLDYSESFRPASSAWRPARRRTIGRAS